MFLEGKTCTVYNRCVYQELVYYGLAIMPGSVSIHYDHLKNDVVLENGLVRLESLT